MARQKMQDQSGLVFSKRDHPALEPLAVKEQIEGARPMNLEFMIELCPGSGFMVTLGEKRGLTAAGPYSEICRVLI